MAKCGKSTSVTTEDFLVYHLSLEELPNGGENEVNVEASVHPIDASQPIIFGDSALMVIKIICHMNVPTY